MLYVFASETSVRIYSIERSTNDVRAPVRLLDFIVTPLGLVRKQVVSYGVSVTPRSVPVSPITSVTAATMSRLKCVNCQSVWQGRRCVNVVNWYCFHTKGRRDDFVALSRL